MHLLAPAFYCAIHCIFCIAGNDEKCGGRTSANSDVGDDFFGVIYLSVSVCLYVCVFVFDCVCVLLFRLRCAMHVFA